jgi:MFS family permease
LAPRPHRSLIVTSLIIGCAIGASISSIVADSALGRKGTIQIACVLVILGAAGQCLAPTYLIFNLARVAAGLGIGFSSALTPVYISEVSEASNRGMMVTFNQ